MTATLARDTRSLPQLPLSDAPRRPAKLAPLPPVVYGEHRPIYLGDFQEMYAYVVGLHAHNTYDLAKELYGQSLQGQEIHLHLRRDTENEHDENAVACYLKVNGSFDLVGYLAREDAAEVAPELDAGAELRAQIVSRPQGGRRARGGCAEVKVFRKD